MVEALENSICQPDFNKGQIVPSVLLLENLNLLQFLTPDVQLRGSDEKMVEFKVLAVAHRHVIKNYLNVSVSEKLTPVAIAQKLLAKIDLKLDYVGRLGKRENRECVYRFVAPDDERDSIFGQWFNRDEVFSSESVSVINNIDITTQVIDTTSQLIPKNTDLVSVTNNKGITTQLTDTSQSNPLSLNQVESPATLGWKGLKLKMLQGLDSAGKFYTELVSTIGSSVGVADGEPYWNGCLGQWLFFGLTLRQGVRLWSVIGWRWCSKLKSNEYI